MGTLLERSAEDILLGIEPIGWRSKGGTEPTRAQKGCGRVCGDPDKVCAWFLHSEGRFLILFSLRKEGRVALLASKRAIDSQSHSQREELLRSSALNEKQGSNEKVG